MGGKQVLAHRWVMASIHGWDAVEGFDVMHLCDNRRCFRYDHLRVGTRADNVADMHAKGRAHKRALHGTNHPNHKLTEEEVLHIYNSPDRGVDLADEFGVTKATISKIKRGQAWAWLTQEQRNNETAERQDQHG